MIAKYCEFNAAKMYNEKKMVLYVACILLQSKKKKIIFSTLPTTFYSPYNIHKSNYSTVQLSL